MEKVKSSIAWVIAGLLTALYLYSAYNKFANPAGMDQMKLSDWAVIIPVGEIISAILFLVPKTNKLGTLLLSSYMGGAIIIHMTSATSIAMPTVVLILVWVVAFLRNPAMFSLKNK